MRVSTQLMHQLATGSILEQQAKTTKQQQHLSTGRKILTPADDPVAAEQVLEMERSLKRTEQYQSNGDRATLRLETEEGVLEGAELQLQRMRELAIQAANGTQTTETRGSIAQEMRQILDEMLSLANATDGNGEYLFSGYKGKTQPFNFDTAGNVVYSGDQGQRFLQIGDGRQVPVSDSGYATFMAVPNGNGTFYVNANVDNKGTGVIDPGSVFNYDQYDGDDYQIQFANRSDALVDGTSRGVFNDAPPPGSYGGFDLAGALDPDDAPIALPTFTLNDDAGNPHNVDVTFSQTGNPGEWDMQVDIDGGTYIDNHTVSFDADGQLATIDGNPGSAITLANFAPGGASDVDLEVNLAGVNQLEANGTPGETTAIVTQVQDAVTTLDNALEYELRIDGQLVFTQAEGDAPLNDPIALRDAINDSPNNPGVTAYVDESDGALYLVRNDPGNTDPIQIQETLNDPNGDIIDPLDTVTGYFGTELAGDGATSTINGDPIELPTGAAENYIVTNSVGDVVTAGEYADNGEIRFSGIKTKIEGEPEVGDRFNVSPSENRDVFSTLQSMIQTLEEGVANDVDNAEFRNRINNALMDLDAGLDNITDVRAKVGARLNAIDGQQDINETFTLNAEQIISDLQDLDYASAISEFNVQLLGLQAAQQSYVKIQGLSLFNYL